jgi:hypothetical protein
MKACTGELNNYSLNILLYKGRSIFEECGKIGSPDIHLHILMHA